MADGGVPRYTVDDALLAMGFGKFQSLVLLYAGFGWISEAMEMMLLSFVGPAVKSEWLLTSNQESLFTSVVFAGMLVGAYTWGVVSDRFGRRKGFLFTALVTSGAGFLSSMAPNYIALLISRCLVGLGLGGGPVLFAWFMEFVPAPRRGLWMVIFQTLWSVGTIIEAALAWVVMPRLGWRWLLGLSALPSFLLLVFYSMTPESLRYLCLKGNKNDAQRILEKVALLNGKELPSGVLITNNKFETQGNSLLLEDTQSLLSGEEENLIASTEWKDSDMGVIELLLTLLSPRLIRSTLLLWIVFFGNLFSYYGLVLLTTELNNGDNQCQPTEMQSKNSAGVDYGDVFITSLAGYVLSAITVDKFGRKPSVAAISVVSCFFLLPLVVHQSTGLTTALLFGARASISASFTIIYIYAPEIYSTSVRTTGVGVASAMGRIGGMVCPLVAVSLVQGCKQTAAILLFVGVVFVSGLCVLFLPFETKGRQLVDTLSISTANAKPGNSIL
uniref:Major facilitator superfamily (MFS) profile domain-containing protein n=3 Tax=Rhizophora mucronata TaxID=61149 RepID=A0A2P2MJ65_RHIMU